MFGRRRGLVPRPPRVRTAADGSTIAAGLAWRPLPVDPQMYGWQWGMFAPGIVGTAMGLLILLGVRDSPEASERRRSPLACSRHPVLCAHPLLLLACLLRCQRLFSHLRLSGGASYSCCATCHPACPPCLRSWLPSCGGPQGGASQRRRQPGAQGEPGQPAGQRLPQVSWAWEPDAALGMGCRLQAAARAGPGSTSCADAPTAHHPPFCSPSLPSPPLLPAGTRTLWAWP